MIHEFDTRTQRDLRCGPDNEVRSRFFQVFVRRPHIFLHFTVIRARALAPRPAVIRFALIDARAHSDDKRNMRPLLGDYIRPFAPSAPRLVLRSEETCFRETGDMRHARSLAPAVLSSTRTLKALYTPPPLWTMRPALKITARSEKAMAMRHEFSTFSSSVQQSSNVPMSFSKRSCTRPRYACARAMVLLEEKYDARLLKPDALSLSRRWPGIW